MDVFVMTKNGARAVPEATVLRDLADMAERYAQADVRVLLGQNMTVEMPAGVATDWWLMNQKGIVFPPTFYLTTGLELRLESMPRIAIFLQPNMRLVSSQKTNEVCVWVIKDSTLTL